MSSPSGQDQGKGDDLTKVLPVLKIPSWSKAEEKVKLLKLLNVENFL